MLLENCEMLVNTGQREVAGWPPYCIFTLGRKTEAGRWDDTKQCEGQLDAHKGEVLKRCVS